MFFCITFFFIIIFFFFENPPFSLVNKVFYMCIYIYIWSEFLDPYVISILPHVLHTSHSLTLFGGYRPLFLFHFTKTQTHFYIYIYIYIYPVILHKHKHTFIYIYIYIYISPLAFFFVK